VWESERVLFVEFDGPTPHTVMASVLDVGGVVVNKLAILQPGAAAAWGDLREAGEVPMPLSAQPAEEGWPSSLRCCARATCCGRATTTRTSSRSGH